MEQPPVERYTRLRIRLPTYQSFSYLCWTIFINRHPRHCRS